MSPDALAQVRLLLPGATVVDTPGATVIVVPTTVVARDELVALGDAARIAKTSVRVLREAIRSGDLAGFGGQRDRSVRREDLDGWIEARRIKPVAGPADDDISRRMRRLAKGQAA